VSRAQRRSTRRPESRSGRARGSRFHVDAPGPASPAWAHAAALAVVAAYAVATIALIAGPHRIGDVFTETDFYGAYGPGARAIQHGHLDPARYAVVGPVFELVLALFAFVVRPLFLAAEIVSLLAMAATLLCWERIVRERAGPLAALVSTALLASNAQFVRYGYAATTDALALALQAGALALLLTGAPTPRRTLAAGLVAGLAFLTRYSAAVLLPAGAVALLLGWAGAAQGRRAAALRFSAGFLVPVVPWIAGSLLSGAHFQFQLHHDVAYEVFARARGITWDTYQRTLQSQFPTPWSVFARDPVAVTSRMLVNVVDHLRLDVAQLTGAALAIAAAAGLWLGARDGTLGRLRAVWLACALAFLALVPAFHSERYSLAVLPAWTALAGLALSSPRLALVFEPAPGRRVWLKPALALVVLALGVRDAIAVQARVIDQLPREVLQVAAEAKPFFRPGDRVLARKPHFAWEAGLVDVPFPFVDSLAQLAAAARADSVRWLYFSWPEAEMRPAFAFLLDTTSAVPGLTLRAFAAHHPAALYEIGPGFGAEPAWAGDPWQAAVHHARAMRDVNLRDWRVRLLLANDAQRRGLWPDAEPPLDEALAIAPDEPEVLLAAGDNLVHLHRYDEAREVYLRAEQRAPGNVQGRVGLGWASLLSGDAPEASRWWRPLILNVDDPETLERMIELFTVLHDDEAASQARARRLAVTGGR